MMLPKMPLQRRATAQLPNGGLSGEPEMSSLSKTFHLMNRSRNRTEFPNTVW